MIVAAVLVRLYLPGPWPWRHGPPAAPAIPGDGRFYLGVDSSARTLAAYDAAVVAYHKPVFIRLDWEMNGSWYPDWSQPAVSPSAYVASWQHVWTIFHDAGVTNASFVWCPNVGDFGGVPWTDWYPGPAYVDWVGMDAYPKPSNLTGYVSGAGGLDAFAQYAQQIGKPAMLAEWAPGDSTDPTADFDAVFDWAASYPNAVKALVYFNFSGGGQDYLLADDPTGAALMRRFVEQNRADLSGVGGTG